MMKFRLYIIIILISLGAPIFISCEKDQPVDEEDRLITWREDAFISFFDLLGSDHRTVLINNTTVIDTVGLTVTATARFGTNIRRVKPHCAVPPDAVVEPKMGEWMDFTEPQTFTVISGNREVRRTYTITVEVQE